MNLQDQVKARRIDILRASAKHGAHSVRLFGSVARGEAGPSSDVDLLIDLEPGRTLLDLVALQLELEALLNRRVDIKTERGLKDRIRARVVREAIPL